MMNKAKQLPGLSIMTVEEVRVMAKVCQARETIPKKYPKLSTVLMIASLYLKAQVS